MSTPIEPVGPGAYADLAPGDAAAPGVDPDHPSWGGLGGIGLWLASFILMVICQALFLIPYTMQQGVNLRELENFATNDPTAVFLQIASLVPAHLLTLGVAWLIVTRIGKRPFFASLGWGWGTRFRPRVNALLAVALAVVLLAVGYTIIYLTGNPETPLDKVLKSSRATALAAAFLAAFTAPFVEEVVYRGVLYSGLRKWLGALWGGVIVVLLFAAVHVPQYITSPGVIATIVMLSAILTVVRARTGQLLPCFVIHLVFNGIQSFFIVMEPYLERLAPEAPTPAPDPALVATLLSLFGLHL